MNETVHTNNMNAYPALGYPVGPWAPSADMELLRMDDTGKEIWALACPCNKFDRFCFRQCRSYQFRSVADIRTHLRRFHMQPPFCPTCKVTFKGKIAMRLREQHIRKRSCTDMGAPVPGGITPDMWNNIATVSDANRGARRSVYESWAEIWRELYPRHPPPPLNGIYHTCSEFTEDLSDVVDDLEANYLPAIINSSVSQGGDTNALLLFWRAVSHRLKQYQGPVQPNQVQINATAGAADGLWGVGGANVIENTQQVMASNAFQGQMYVGTFNT